MQKLHVNTKLVFNVLESVSHRVLFQYSVHQELGMAFCESYWVINLST